MSFTQETRMNIKRCDGCENHCRIEVEVPSIRANFWCDGCKNHCRLEVTTDATGNIFYPVIGGKTITSYIDKNGEPNTAGKPKEHFEDEFYYTTHKISIAMLDIAREIAKLCDHYKTR